MSITQLTPGVVTAWNVFKLRVRKLKQKCKTGLQMRERERARE